MKYYKNFTNLAHLINAHYLEQSHQSLQIQKKTINFTHFSSKTPRISSSKLLHISNFTTITV